MATIAVFAALARRKKKTMPTIQPKSTPNHGATVAAPNCSPIKRSMSSFRASIASPIWAPVARWSVCGRMLGNESIAQPRSAVPPTTSIATGRIAFSDVRDTFG